MVTGLAFIAPWVVGFLVFFGYNLVQTIIYSFNTIEMNTAGGGFTMTFIGMQNYKTAFLEHATFVRQLTESMGNILLDVPLIMFLSRFIAWLLNRKFKEREVVL